jgi:hypothetical protein
LHLGVQVNDDTKTPAQARLRLSTRPFANFAPLRLCENPSTQGGVLAKAQRRKVRKDFSLNTKMQTAIGLLDLQQPKGWTSCAFSWGAGRYARAPNENL